MFALYVTHKASQSKNRELVVTEERKETKIATHNYLPPCSAFHKY